jgi:Zn-dependent protease with chaperone function
VLAHEFAHIGNKDMLVRSLIGALFRPAPLSTSFRHQGLATDVAMMFVLAYKLLTALVFFAVTRSRERLADTTAAHAVGSTAMLDALRRIAELSDAGDRTAMFSTHPGLRSRIEMLSDCC